jgi:sugar lactone lactonase YvrE
MRIHRPHALAIVTVALAAGTIGSATGPAHARSSSLPAAGSTVRVVADHLDNPRGLFADSTGTLWVAEAGRGGQACAMSHAVCYGLTGAIVRVRHGRATTFSTGLASIHTDLGTLGVDDVSVAPNGSVFTAMISDDTLLTKRIKRTTLRGELGELLRFGAHGQPRSEATVARLRGPYSHPYGVLALRDRELVTDSEQNTLIEVRGHRAQVIFHFPAGYNSADSVPTSLAMGPDGAVYIGELSGFEAGAGHARIWKMIPGQPPQVWATGFSAIVGLAFGPDGSLYVCEFSRNFPAGDRHGDVVRVAPDGSRTTLGAGQLFRPGGIAVARNGNVYVSNWSTLIGTPNRAGHRGQVVELAP